MNKIKRKAILLGSIIVVVLIGFLGTANLYKLYAYYYRAPRLNLNIKSQVYKNDKFKVSGNISPCYNKHSKVNLYRKYTGKRYYTRIARLSANRKCQFSYYTRLSKTATFKAKIYDRYVYSKARKVTVKTKPVASSAPPAPPAPPAPELPSAIVAFYGDSQSNNDGYDANHQKAVNNILSTSANPIFHAGDLMEDGTLDSLNRFNSVTSLLRSTRTFYSSLGNNDRDLSDATEPSPLYLDNFSFPGNERWYSLNIGNLHMVVLDSAFVTDEGDEAEKQAELAWLQSDLQAASTQTPRIIGVMYHHPTGVLADAIDQYLIDYGADFVIAGHVHTYLHTDSNGIDYFTSTGQPSIGYFLTKVYSTYAELNVYDSDNALTNTITINNR